MSSETFSEPCAPLDTPNRRPSAGFSHPQARYFHSDHVGKVILFPTGMGKAIYKHVWLLEVVAGIILEQTDGPVRGKNTDNNDYWQYSPDKQQRSKRDNCE